MSSMGNWTYVYQLTVWPVTFDDAAQPVFGTPYLLMSDWAVGGKAQTDANGIQFAPESTYYFEAADGSALIPKPKYYVLRGDNTATADPTTVNAEIIKKVGGWGMEMFGAELPDWVIYT